MIQTVTCVEPLVPFTLSFLFLIRFDEYTLKPDCMKSITALLGENLEAGALMFYAQTS